MNFTPFIGKLIRNGHVVFYAYIGGRKHERLSQVSMFNWMHHCHYQRGMRIGV